MFGSNQLYVVYHPYSADKQKESNELLKRVTFELAQEEIARNRGFDMDRSGKSTGAIFVLAS